MVSMVGRRSRSFTEPVEGILRRSGLAYLDLGIVAGALGLVAASLVTLAASTQELVEGSPLFYVTRQSIYAGVGFLIMLALARFDYSRFRELRVGLYAALIVSILFVLAFGVAARGSQRWIELPYFTFQPSELGKVILILALAGFTIDRAKRLPEGQRTARLVLLGLFPAAVVFVQPDLGTGLVYGVITLSILFVAGVRWTHFAALGGAAVVAVTLVLAVAPAIGTPLLHDYQQSRLTAFINPSEDPGAASYQSLQAIIAVGSGQKTGRGAEATQTQLDFLPEHHTDFIFAVVGERFGFVGAAFVLSLYALLFWRALRILTISKNLYGTLIAGGIASIILFQVFVNVGMSIGVMPITGIPLPLMSYGGSSVLVTFMALGLLQSIFIQSQLTSKGRQRPF